MALAALAGLGLLWAVCAQDIVLPPPVLQPDLPLPVPAEKPIEKPPEKKTPAAAKGGQPLPAVRDKGKGETLFGAPDVFDAPGAGGGKQGLLLMDGGAVPPPNFPPAPGPAEPLPLPLPIPPVREPTKALIEPLGQAPPAPPSALPMPVPTPVPTPIPQPEPKKGADAQPPPMLKFPTPPESSPAAVAKPKAFVRIKPAGSGPAPAPLDVVAGPAPGIGSAPLPPPAANYVPNPGALLSVQMPALAVEKRGPPVLRGGETQPYQIVVRNLGAIPAQQIRIEDDIPPGGKLLLADPPPQFTNGKAVWNLSYLPGQGELTIRFSLQADAPLQIAAAVNVTLQAGAPTVNTTVMRPAEAPGSLAVQLTGPERVALGAPVNFDVKIANQSAVPVSDVKLFAYLPEGLDTPDGRAIEMTTTITLPPGGYRILQMPAKAVGPGRQIVRVKVASSGGEAWASAAIDIPAADLTVRQAEFTRLFLGRDGDLHIEAANGSARPLRHVQVACVLPEGIDFVAASNGGMLQSNRHTVYWLIDTLPAGHTQSLAVRVNGTRAGQYKSIVSAWGDGVGKVHSEGTIRLEGVAGLKLRVVDRDNLLEIGKQGVYEIHLENPGGAPARNVKVRVECSAGLIPSAAQADARFSIQGQAVVFDPIMTIAPNGQAVLRVSAQAMAAGDQRVRVTVVSDELQSPLQREVSTRVY